MEHIKYEYHRPRENAFLGLSTDIKQDDAYFPVRDHTIKILWNRNTAPVQVCVDDYTITLKPNQLVSITYLQEVSFSKTQLPLTSFSFNREFYCIIDHDEEVSCNGILFFGTQDLPIVSIPYTLQQRFETLFSVFVEEFTTPDKIQGQMLQMLLKRLIIMVTRLAKEQLIVKALNNDQIETIRKFNVLVDIHYKTKRKVSDYAELLHKSPKTLSNLFAIYNQKTPQHIILERLALEAKRLMNFTDKQNQEIAYELGFNDPAHFSRFFKKMTQFTPSEYRNSQLMQA
ncbi:helix-turn-helix domain-containing protein [Flavobacterium sp. ASW18X]|uniref:helix-turn-helix domain-containing protein n=1 Tax=Flavobacterium sp. ASW18X TaxID=2572595 RepID=UPI0010AE6F48|nr:helix-turn-helix domain-containing protein [Flavobacterium sp. ASW18X]TKD65228.1 helix-turn-helix domain-containing protein [Flavobacterium sp. ASW18X]